MRASQSTSRAISPSERTAAPESRRQAGDVGGQRAGDELALADEAETASAMLRSLAAAR